MTLELIERLTKVFKDYCGVLTEESMKKNFTLIYELLDEVIVRGARAPCAAPSSPWPHPRHARLSYIALPSQDYGYAQGTSTELLKAHVYNEPIVVEAARSATFKVPTMSAKTTPSSAVHKPISLAGRKGRKNEIFVDILERLTVLFNSNVGGGLECARLPPCPTLFITRLHRAACTGLHLELHHRRMHPDEELLVRQPAATIGFERGLDSREGKRRRRLRWRGA